MKQLLVAAILKNCGHLPGCNVDQTLSPAAQQWAKDTAAKLAGVYPSVNVLRQLAAVLVNHKVAHDLESLQIENQEIYLRNLENHPACPEYL